MQLEICILVQYKKKRKFRSDSEYQYQIGFNLMNFRPIGVEVDQFENLSLKHQSQNTVRYRISKNNKNVIILFLIENSLILKPECLNVNQFENLVLPFHRYPYTYSQAIVWKPKCLWTTNIFGRRYSPN